MENFIGRVVAHFLFVQKNVSHAREKNTKEKIKVREEAAKNT